MCILANKMKEWNIKHSHGEPWATRAKMTALVAAMRKLLTIINTMIAKGENWNPKTA
jgi:hypothetical protein